MNFDLVHDDKVYMHVRARNEGAAWAQIRKAGFMNKSKQFKLLKIDETKQVDSCFSGNVVGNVIGNKVIIPSRKSYKFTR